MWASGLEDVAEALGRTKGSCNIVRRGDYEGEVGVAERGGDV